MIRDCLYSFRGVVFAAAVLFGACGRLSGEQHHQTDDAPPLFTEIAESANLDFVHFNGMSGQKYMVEMTGAGGAFLDYDNDGDLDVYLVQGGSIETGPSEGTVPYTDKLYRNDLVVYPDGSRRMTFVDVTDSSGLNADGYGMGVATGDFDNDGWVDIYVTNWGSNQLWKNNGDGTFADVTDPETTGDPKWSTSASFIDFDRDGFQDLFVVNYLAYRLEIDHPCYIRRSGRRDYCGPTSYEAAPDRLLRNRGDGTFEDVSLQMGMTRAIGRGLGVVVSDLNGDGFADVYVANDGEANQMWMNLGGKRFDDAALMGGTAYNASGGAEASMGVVAADLYGNGREDLFMTHLNGETNTLYANTGKGLFDDVTRASSLGPPSWPLTGFGTVALDYDLDGWLDLFVANGEVRIIPEQADRGNPLPLNQRNQLFRNMGDGRFQEVPDWAGPLSNIEEVSRGAAVGDVDNDGDADLLVMNNNGPVRLLRNDVVMGGWIGLRLVDGDAALAQSGSGLGHMVLGSKAVLVREDGAAVLGRSHTDGSYLSAHDPRIRFGIDASVDYDRVDVYWPDGHVESWTNLAPGIYHTLYKGAGSP